MYVAIRDGRRIREGGKVVKRETIRGLFDHVGIGRCPNTVYVRHFKKPKRVKQG